MGNWGIATSPHVLLTLNLALIHKSTCLSKPNFGVIVDLTHVVKIGEKRPNIAIRDNENQFNKKTLTIWHNMKVTNISTRNPYIRPYSNNNHTHISRSASPQCVTVLVALDAAFRQGRLMPVAISFILVRFTLPSWIALRIR